MAGCDPALIAFANGLADLAGPVLRRYFDARVDADTKSDNSPVTIADREAERLMRARIEASYPEHGIMGEEFGAVRADAEFVWVLDPVDGTKAFLVHKLTFGTLIALAHRGRPILGIIDQPVLGHRWVGAAGQPTLFNGQPARTRACAGIGEAIVNATAADLFDAAEFAAFQRVAKQSRFTHWGGDCYAFGLVASGYVDLAIEAGLKTHDIMALVPVIEGAGGAVTDWTGAAHTLHTAGRIIAAGDRRLLEPVIATLAG